MSVFDFPSFIIGLLLGMIIMLILVWICYYTRSFAFSQCATTSRVCYGSDYFNNPGDALAHGAQIDDILFLNNEGELLYKRVPKTSDCVPGDNQTVRIIFPQYCSFSGNGITGTWRETAFNSNIYKPVDGTVGPTVVTSENCQPSPGFVVTDGIPLIRWDENPISD